MRLVRRKEQGVRWTRHRKQRDRQGDTRQDPMVRSADGVDRERRVGVEVVKRGKRG